MTCFLELEENELLSVEGGDVLSSIGYAGAAYSAASLSGMCFGAITASAPAIVTAGCITGGLGFGALGLICVTGALISLAD